MVDKKLQKRPAKAKVKAKAKSKAKAKATSRHKMGWEKPPKVKVGDQVPDVSFDKGFPPEKVPGYKAKERELKAKGVSDVLIYCVNDGAVMSGWAKDQGIQPGGLISFLGDTSSEVTQALGVVLDHPGPMSVLGVPRCKRFSMLIDNGIIKTINVACNADDPAGDADPSATLVEKMLEDL